MKHPEIVSGRTAAWMAYTGDTPLRLHTHTFDGKDYVYYCDRPVKSGDNYIKRWIDFTAGEVIAKGAFSGSVTIQNVKEVGLLEKLAGDVAAKTNRDIRRMHSLALPLCDN